MHPNIKSSLFWLNFTGSLLFFLKNPLNLDIIWQNKKKALYLNNS